jgi:FMN phosphatase YigB (HAD superfamily)
MRIVKQFIKNIHKIYFSKIIYRHSQLRKYYLAGIKWITIFIDYGWEASLQNFKNSIKQIKKNQPYHIPINDLPTNDRSTFFVNSHDFIEFGDAKIAFVIHVFYVDLFDEICSYLNLMPVPYSVFISVKSQEDKEFVNKSIPNLRLLKNAEVKIVPNRGRDIAPMLVDFAQSLLKFNYICHIHTKKSLRTGQDRYEWRLYLYDMLLGSEDRIKSILSVFQRDPTVGIIYPEAFVDAPYWGATWLGNKWFAQRIHENLNIRFDPDEYIEFPAGSMFWARSAALKPLFNLGFTYNDFPIEQGQHDGTLQHTIERIFTIIAKDQGYKYVIIQNTKINKFSYRSERNIREYLRQPFPEKIKRMLPFCQVVSIDIFDTLLIRPFANPDMLFKYLEESIEKTFSISNFMDKRKNSENVCRSKKNFDEDVNISEIYLMMAEIYNISDEIALQLMDIEVSTEKKLFIPREQVINAAQKINKIDKRIVLVTDTYFERHHIEEILKEKNIDFYSQLYVSSEIGKRKDRGDVWDYILIAEKVEKGKLLHIGDNEKSDIHILVTNQFLHPIHIMRPSALFHQSILGEQLFNVIKPFSAWRENLLYGLFSNYYCKDPSPMEFFDYSKPALNNPFAFGYTVIGPIVFNYITWIINQSKNDGVDHLLFCARDGYLLHQIYQILYQYLINLDPNIQLPKSNYFLISRRAAIFTSLKEIDDIQSLIDSHYYGTIRDFFEKRWNVSCIDMIQDRIGSDVLNQFIIIPRDHAFLYEVIESVWEIVRKESEIERQTLIRYYDEMMHSNLKKIGIVDIGYSGSVQKSLINLFGQSFAGYYFVTSEKVKKISNNNICKGYYGEFAELDSVSCPPIYKYSLLMEAILIAPEGQLIRFIETPTGIIPIFKQQTIQDKNNYSVINQIHTGIIDFVLDMIELFGISALDIEFPKDKIQTIYQMVINKEIDIGELKNNFIVEDDFSGLGNLAIFNLYNPTHEQR